jgi:hypothetical protein
MYHWHRPRVRKAGGKFIHARKSSFFGTGKVMLNPRRHRKHRRNPVRFARRHRRHMRRNPNVKAILNQLKSKTWLMQTATITGGIVAGLASKSLVGMIMEKAKLSHYEKFGGALQIVLGAVLYATMRKPALRTIGGMIAGFGLYDLVQQNVKALPIPALPVMNIPGLPMKAAASYGYAYGPRPLAIPSAMPAPRAIAASYGASYTPASGMSGMENPYGDIEW